MKKAVSIIIFLAIYGGAIAQEQKEITTVISSAILFPDRAQLFHTGEVPIGPGVTILKIKGLSPGIITETMQVEGVGDFMIMSVNQQVNYLDNTRESEEVTALRLKIKVLTEKIEDETTAMEILREKEAFLVANRLISSREQGVNAAEFKLLTDQYVSGIESVRSGILKKTRVVRDLREEKSKLENQLAGAVNRSKMPGNELMITLSSTKSLTAKLSFSYLVMNAGWFPSYDIRVSGTDAPASIFYKANAWQNTGLDWKNIRLGFSSSSPSLSGVMPVLYPWFINFYQENNIRVRGMASKSAPVSMMADRAEMEVMEMDMEEAYAPPVTITEGATNFTFNLETKQSISSDGRPVVIELQRLSADAIYKYEAIPKLREKVYLTAGISDWESLNLIDGEANIYFGNAFTGKSFISRSQLSDTLTISLGQDAGIIIKREKRTDYEATRMIGSNRVDTRSYLITVKNNRKNSIDISLTDQVPLSQNSQIVVEPTELSGGTIDRVKGKVKWNFNLGPNQSREIIITYTVKYPKNQKVILEN